MANPIFSKPGTPDVVLTNAFDLASGNPVGPRQNRQRSYLGDYKVLTRGRADQIFGLIGTDMLKTDADALLVFFESAVVLFGERPFLYTDHLGVERQMRYLDANLPGIPTGPGSVRLALTLTLDRGPFD